LTDKDTSLEKPRVETLDQILGKVFKVFDDGFIRVIDYMGNDQAIVQAARVSYGTGTKQVHQDRGLIRYLLRHRHSTPFEMCEIKFHVRVPMDAWRQWIRHRTANINEYSTRYSVAIDAAQKTEAGEWRLQTQSNRQGSSGYFTEEEGRYFTDQERELHDHTRSIYEDRVEKGVAREQARKDLPLSTYTEAYWKIDLHNLLHFLALRMHPHAQLEIRRYAEVIGKEIVSRWCPHTWEAFLDYRYEATGLSALETQLLPLIIGGESKTVIEKAKSFGWLNYDGEKLKSNRERAEFEQKLEQWGLKIPW